MLVPGNGVTAHRGDSAHAPENTLPAFAAGQASGADWLELDVHQSADGHLVVCHDATTGRTGDRDLVIAETSLSILRSIDISTGFRREHPDLPFEPTSMPLLVEVLELVLKERRARLSIQPKSACVPQIARLVLDMGAEAWVGFNDGDPVQLTEARERLPEAAIFYDTPPGLSALSPAIQTALQRGFDAIVMHQSTMSAMAVGQIEAAGLQAGVWTVNDRTAMARFLGMGVKRFYTDDPGLLLATMNE